MLQTEQPAAGQTPAGGPKQVLLWFTKSFPPSIGSDRPQILILDGHDSHNFLELIDTALDDNIHIVELPSHTSNWLQPRDRSVYGPFKTAYRTACDDLMNTFPGSLVSQATFVAS